MNHDLSNVNTWLGGTANKLTLNSFKTEFMFIGSRQRLGNYDTSPKLIIDGDIIKQVSSVKSLGVQIDENLSWNMHIEKSHRALEQLNVVGLLLTELPWSPFSMP